MFTNQKQIQAKLTKYNGIVRKRASETRFFGFGVPTMPNTEANKQASKQPTPDASQIVFSGDGRTRVKEINGILKEINGLLKEINGILKETNGILKEINGILEEIN